MVLLIVVLALLFGASLFWRVSPEGLTIETAVLVVSWIAGFILYYGTATFRNALFPLFFLFLMVPLPEFLHMRVVVFLQNASAVTSFALLKSVHATVFRDGLVLRFPSIDIEVAPECSGIRSSLALLITILLSGEFVLRSVWSKSLLVLAVVPVAIIKNAIRIATISLLTVYVNPAFIHSWIHKSGGMVFYALALLLFVPIVLGLRHLESRIANSATRV
jgi:exosortase